MPVAQATIDDDSRVIDGLRYPRPEKQLDRMGCEATKHALRFRGADWDLPLTKTRDDMTKRFTADAAEATSLPEASIEKLRFVVGDGALFVKFTVRHKPQVTKQAIQEQLANGSWSTFKALYTARTKQPKSSRLRKKQDTETSFGRRKPVNLSFYGRANVGPDGPAFKDGHDEDEEPPPFEAGQRNKSSVMQPLGLGAQRL